MVKIEGKYAHERNENLDEYFKALDIAYMPRKMLGVTKPVLEFRKNENGEWSITTSVTTQEVTVIFKLGEEYEEEMFGTMVKCITTLDEDKLITVSLEDDSTKVTRTYLFTDTQCILTMKHENLGIEAKRYFNRVD